MKSRKQHRVERTELSNQDKMKMLLANESQKYLGMLKADTIKWAEMKEKIKKRILQDNQKITWNQTIWQKFHQIPELFTSYDTRDHS